MQVIDQRPRAISEKETCFGYEIILCSEIFVKTWVVWKNRMFLVCDPEQVKHIIRNLYKELYIPIPVGPEREDDSFLESERALDEWDEKSSFIIVGNAKHIKDRPFVNVTPRKWVSSVQWTG